MHCIYLATQIPTRCRSLFTLVRQERTANGESHAFTHKISFARRHPGGNRLWWHDRAGDVRRTAATRDEPTDSSGAVEQIGRRRAMTRNIPRLIEAFLEMIAAERGATKNTLDAYARDLADYAAELARAGKAPRNAATA